MKTTSAVLLLIVTIFFSFTDKESEKFKGLWKSIGYGKIIDIRESKVKTYDINKVSCIPYYYLTKLNDFMIENQPEFIHQDTVIFSSGITKYKYIRIKELPKTCSGEPYSESRILNFDSYWETFLEYYPYFEERNINWDKIKEKYRPRINDKMSDLDFLMLLKKINREINDDHTNFTWIPNNLQKQYNQNKTANSDTIFFITDSLLIEAQNQTAHQYLSKVNNYNSNTVLWGFTEENLGYLQINKMWGFADYEVKNSLTSQKFWKKYWHRAGKSSNYGLDNNQGIQKLMETIIQRFKDTDGVILDLRFNRGGSDETALKLLSYFNDSNKVVFTKKAKMGEQFTKPQKIILNSQSNSYNKKVVLLTSSETCSAAEIFVLASLRLPNIIRIGNSTSGHFSDAIPKAIPSGWTFRMSMEVYLDQQKKNYEVIGIPPDIKTESTSKALFENLLENKTDAAMIKAIEILRK